MDKLFTIAGQISKNQTLIAELQEHNESLNLEALNMLKNAIQNWKPAINEKAVCICPLRACAWHVWFIETYNDGSYRFKEAPLEIDSNTYYRQKLDDPIEEESEWYIVPNELYLLLNPKLNYYFIKDKYMSLIK